MESALHVDRNEPTIKAICQAVGYYGRSIEIRTTESVTLDGAYWSGGSKSTYLAYRLDNGAVTQPAFNAAPHAYGGQTPTVQIVPNMVIVEHTIFRGKSHGLTLHVAPVTMAGLITDQRDDLPQEQKIVLAATRSLKASYGGIKNFRAKQAREDTGISLEAYEQAKLELIASGHLNKAGAITTKGKNAIQWTQLHKLRLA